MGPTLGGVLSKQHQHLPLATVVALYGLVFVAIVSSFNSRVLGHVKEKYVYEPDGKENRDASKAHIDRANTDGHESKKNK